MQGVSSLAVLLVRFYLFLESCGSDVISFRSHLVYASVGPLVLGGRTVMRTTLSPFTSVILI